MMTRRHLTWFVQKVGPALLVDDFDLKLFILWFRRSTFAMFLV